MGPVGGNVDNGGRNTYRFYEKNHREAGTAEGGRDVVYTGGRGIAGSGGTQLETTYTGKRKGVVVQWVALRPIIQGLCKGDRK